MKSLCSYGCKTKARFTLRSGKVCCFKSPNSCPEQRRKNSEAKRGINPWEGKEHPRGMLGRTAWNAGLTKKTDKRVAQGASHLRKFRRLNPNVGFAKGSQHSAETKARMSASMKAAGSGGYRLGSGRGRKGWYKGIHCDSSWELAFVLWCELKGRKVKRARRKFDYVYQGQTRKYLPDFRYQNSDGAWKYVEVKGYVSAQWKAKKKAFPYELLLISRRSMERVFLPAVIAAHGRDFVRLYEQPG